MSYNKITHFKHPDLAFYVYNVYTVIVFKLMLPERLTVNTLQHLRCIIICTCQLNIWAGRKPQSFPIKVKTNKIFLDFLKQLNFITKQTRDREAFEKCGETTDTGAFGKPHSLYARPL